MKEYKEVAKSMSTIVTHYTPSTRCDWCIGLRNEYTVDGCTKCHECQKKKGENADGTD